MMPENEKSSLPSLPSPAERSRNTQWNPWLIVALLALGLAAWQWLETRQALTETRQEVALRLAEADTGDKEDRGVQKALREEVDLLQAKLGAASEAIDALQAQRAALDQFYQDLSRSREDAALIEVEQAIILAGQQLQLAGNVPVAVLALQTADSRLARLEKPQYLALRKALAKDLERLNALPFVDVPGISLRLEQMIAGIDKMPLAAHGRPVERKPPETADQGTTRPWWRTLATEVWQELRGLIRIQRFDQEEPALLAPGQDFFLRENLKLRLLNARLALLARDQATYRNELKVAQGWLTRHFVADEKAVQAAQASLRQMMASELSLDLPSLNDSQTALRAVRGGKEKR